jgi:hypothetical protein
VTEARQERIARNHSLFREVNQRIVSLTEEFGSHRSHDGDGIALVCECGNGDCTSQLVAETKLYTRVRVHPSRFLVLSGHESPGLEHVVERNGRYIVVERGEASSR